MRVTPMCISTAVLIIPNKKCFSTKINVCTTRNNEEQVALIDSVNLFLVLLKWLEDFVFSIATLKIAASIDFKVVNSLYF